MDSPRLQGGRKGPEEGVGYVKAVWVAVGGRGEPQRVATRDWGFEICDVPSPSVGCYCMKP